MPNDRRRIFVVDDHPSILRSLHRFLKAYGFDPQTFDSAEAFCATGNSDGGLCLVLDINLNGRCGIELSRQLAASGNLLPVIFVTGNDTEHVRKAAIDAGCLAYLPKPIHTQSLLRAIEKAADFWRLNRQQVRLNRGAGHAEAMQRDLSSLLSS